jgi:hypothetical protein
MFFPLPTFRDSDIYLFFLLLFQDLILTLLSKSGSTCFCFIMGEDIKNDHVSQSRVLKPSASE